MSASRYQCGCRKSSVKRKGHHMVCPWYDPERYDSHVTRRDLTLKRYASLERNTRRQIRAMALN
jgi:hypothetical protein